MRWSQFAASSKYIYIVMFIGLNMQYTLIWPAWCYAMLCYATLCVPLLCMSHTDGNSYKEETVYGNKASWHVQTSVLLTWSGILPQASEIFQAAALLKKQRDESGSSRLWESRCFNFIWFCFSFCFVRFFCAFSVIDALKSVTTFLIW